MSQHHTELEEIGRNKTKHSSFDIQPTGCKINIEFSNLSYEVADREGGRNNLKFKCDKTEMLVNV